jgi:mono/diheme cytochrome c family protein
MMMKYPGLAVAIACTALLAFCGKGEPPRASQDSTAAAPDTGRPASPVTPSSPDTAAATQPAAAPPPSAPVTNPKPAKPVMQTPASTADTTAAETPLRDAYHTAPLDTVDAKTYQGWKYFNLNCARCHGEDALGTSIAPHLILSLKPDGPIPNEAVFLQTVCGGRPEKGMPAWCTLGMSTAQIDTIYAYVKGRSDAKIHPGRPARRGG